MGEAVFQMKTCVSSILLGLVVLLGGCGNHLSPSNQSLPKVDHILLEVSDLNASIAFYRDLFKLRVKSNNGHFAMLEAGNTRIALWDKRWDWEKPRTKNERQGIGMYPHLKVADVTNLVNRARQAGYKIIQKPRHYLWGTEAFVTDPDGYIWALVD
jgi:predicted enzyme related to lactoylglutathione lyase